VVVNALDLHLAAEEVDNGHEEVVDLRWEGGYGEGVEQRCGDHDAHGGDGGDLRGVSGQQVAHSKQGFNYNIENIMSDCTTIVRQHVA
jgi:hypothetical protein